MQSAHRTVAAAKTELTNTWSVARALKLHPVLSACSANSVSSVLHRVTVL